MRRVQSEQPNRSENALRNDKMDVATASLLTPLCPSSVTLFFADPKIDFQLGAGSGNSLTKERRPQRLSGFR
jgi:hypothetical protein